MNKQNDNELAHFGIRGMKWGVRRSQASIERSQFRKEDRAIKKERRKDVKRRRHLSDKELVEKIGRLEKEKKLRELTAEEIDPGMKATKEVLKNAGIRTATTVVSGGMLLSLKYGATGKVNPADVASYMMPKPGK